MEYATIFVMVYSRSSSSRKSVRYSWNLSRFSSSSAIDLDAREITDPDRKTENFVLPSIIGMRDSANLDESNGIECSKGLKSKGERNLDSVTILLMLTIGISAIIFIYRACKYIVALVVHGLDVDSAILAHFFFSGTPETLF